VTTSTFERTEINVRLAGDQPLRVREAVQLLRYAVMMPVTSRLTVDGERKAALLAGEAIDSEEELHVVKLGRVFGSATLALKVARR
jgi:hypothetical protein